MHFCDEYYECCIQQYSGLELVSQSVDGIYSNSAAEKIFRY